MKPTTNQTSNEMPKTIRLLTVSFDTKISAEELVGFRGAIVKKVGREYEWFHNHNNQTGGYHHRYPIIQYKRHRHKPMIVCVEQGIEEVHRFFAQPNWNLELKGRVVNMKVDNLYIKEVPLKLTEQFKTYRVYNWVGLNERNLKEYEQLEGLVEKVSFLELKLGASIHAFFKSMDWQPQQRFKIKLLDFSEKKTKIKQKYSTKAFDIKFKADVILPNYIGLGKASSVGFGTVFQMSNDRRKTEGK